MMIYLAGRRLAVVSGVCLAIGLTLGCFSLASASEYLSELCGQRIVRDYEGPLRKMRRLRGPLKPFESQKQTLPFGPSGLSLLRVGTTRVVMQGERFGYRLAAAGTTNRSGLLKQALHLHWFVETRIWAVKRSGVRVRSVARTARYLGDVRDLQRLEFMRSTHSGLYRYDILFRNRDGKILGGYGSYYRVVRRRVGLRIGLNGSVFRAGDKVVGSFENLGTDSVFMPDGSSLDVEYEEAMDQWTAAASGAPRPGVVVIVDPVFVRGGYSLGCTTFDISNDVMPGHYRFSVMVRPFGVAPERRSVVRQFVVE